MNETLDRLCSKVQFFSGAWLKVISEVPFDMFTTASFFNMNWNNVMFTLALVLIVIWSIDILKDKMQKKTKDTLVSGIVCNCYIDVHSCNGLKS